MNEDASTDTITRPTDTKGQPIGGDGERKKPPELDAINRSEMARTLRIDVAHISRILSGKSNPSLKLALRMAKHLGTTVEELYDTLPPKKQKVSTKAKRG